MYLGMVGWQLGWWSSSDVGAPRTSRKSISVILAVSSVLGRRERQWWVIVSGGRLVTPTLRNFTRLPCPISLTFQAFLAGFYRFILNHNPRLEASSDMQDAQGLSHTFRSCHFLLPTLHLNRGPTTTSRLDCVRQTRREGFQGVWDVYLELGKGRR